MSGDEAARRIILARRAKFVAAALATVACGKSGGGGDGCGPRPCLEPPIVATLPDADPPPTRDGSFNKEAGIMFVSDAGDAGAGDAAAGDAGRDAGPRQARDGGPVTQKPKRPPEPCLNVYLSEDDK